MDIDTERVKALIQRLKGMSPAARDAEFEKLAKTDPKFLEQVRTLVAAVKAMEDGAPPATSGLPRETILAAAQSPRVQHLASALDSMAPGLTSGLMARLTARAPGLAEALKAAMFTFEDLMHVDNRGLQLLIRKADKKTLKYALRGAPADLAARIYSQMSRRAGTDLREDIDMMGPTRRSEIENAQRELADLGRKLERKGKLILRRPGSANEYV